MTLQLWVFMTWEYINCVDTLTLSVLAVMHVEVTAADLFTLFRPSLFKQC